ncbi:MAG: hypothetical protein QOJ88_845 [Pyrinomonadaceae bacterium]|jgi:hypothetical protein|nr:hypothetical protein [Pyrinomonadaceae bacterium]
MPKPFASRWKSRTRNDLIIEVWEALDCESVGAHELRQIQRALLEQFGDGALASPAAIARVVADEGAVLRHREVFACDLEWREQILAAQSFSESLDFSGLAAAFASLVKIEARRLELGGNSDDKARADLRAVVSAAREDSSLRARSRIIAEGEREQAREVSQWLSLWLQSPELFSDWLELRRRSPEFRRKFPDAGSD